MLSTHRQLMRSGHSAASDSKPPFQTTVIQQEFSLQEGLQSDMGITNTANSHLTHTVCTFPAIHSLVYVQKPVVPMKGEEKVRGV